MRATDEGVPQALAGYRPTVTGSRQRKHQRRPTAATTIRGVVDHVEQPLFTGCRTVNGVKMAETAVLAGREVLRTTEQTTLLSAVTAFMDLVQAQAMLNLQRQNVDFLQQQVRAAQDRLNVGEGTRTDVAQTNARLAAGQSDYNAAVAALNTAHRHLRAGDRPSAEEPRRGQAGRRACCRSRWMRRWPTRMTANPSILAAGYNIDIADYNVKVQEGSLLPTPSLTGTLSHTRRRSAPGIDVDTASADGRLSVPIYTRGARLPRSAQAKETLGQRRIELDAAVAAIRQAVISAWGPLDAARAQIRAADAQVRAQNLVLSGVSEQQKVGQSTTLDVLNAQQDLLNARLAQVSAQHDRVVAAYSLLCRDRHAERRDARPQGGALRPDRPLHAGPRQVGRPADAGRALSPDGARLQFAAAYSSYPVAKWL